MTKVSNIAVYLLFEGSVRIKANRVRRAPPSRSAEGADSEPEAARIDAYFVPSKAVGAGSATGRRMSRVDRVDRVERLTPEEPTHDAHHN